MLHPLIFLHLPKAAGTSFKLALRELLPLGTLISEVNGSPDLEVVRALTTMDPQQRAKLRAVMAHVPYGLHTLLPKAKYVTVLREPISRLLSTYYFAKSRSEFEFSKKIAAGMTIEEFAADVFNENAQVRRLMKYPDISREGVFLDPPAGQLTRTHLDDARDTLRRCAVVGLAERYDEFLDCVSAEFGLPPISGRDDNVTAIPWHREEVPARTIERLREINQLDLELYEYAEKLARKQAAKRAAKSAATRYMRPLYAQASGREALEAENKRLGAELVNQTAERERVAAELSQHKQESARQAAELVIENERLRGELARHKDDSARLVTEQVAERERFHAELSWHKEESGRLAAELAAERERFDAEVSWHKEESGRLAAELAAERERFHAELSQHQAESARLVVERANERERLQVELSRMEEQLSRQREESARFEAKLTHSIDELRLQLKAMYTSTSWKITKPLRRLTEFARRSWTWRARSHDL
jgi:hypothetical protein